jgi:RNA polymerase sigma factor (sigma-70 family)
MLAIAHSGFGSEDPAFFYTLTEQATWRLIREWHVRWEGHERQDFVSDTYAYKVLPQQEKLDGRPEPSQRAFIYQAVEWAYFDKVKRQGRQPQLLMDDTKLELLPQVGRAPDPASAVEARDVIVKAFGPADLSEYEQEVYLLSEVKGWSYAEIAKQLGKSKATIRTAVCRARQKLEAFLISQGNPVEKV